MTVTEYLEQDQPINNTVDKSGEYTEFSTISLDYARRQGAVRIFISHVDKDTWSFGWDVKELPISRKCNENMIVHGKRNCLVFGIIKVLISKLHKYEHIDGLQCVLNAAARIAAGYISQNRPISKVRLS